MAKCYPQITEGQKIDLNWRKDDYLMACCDCNLVHRVRYTVVGDKLRIRAWRENRRTAALRRWRGHRSSFVVPRFDDVRQGRRDV